MSESANKSKMLFQLSAEELEQIVERAVTAALSKRGPEKRLFSVKEAAVMLSVEESWLSVRARAKLIPFRMMGRYVHFSPSDIEAITVMAAVDRGGIPEVGGKNGTGHHEPLVIESNHGQEASRVLPKDRKRRRQEGKAHTDNGAGQADGKG